MKRVIRLVVALLLGKLSLANGGTLNITVADSRGTPVADAVVYAVPTNGARPAGKRTAIIDQINQQFVPYVSAVQVGTAVTFPNHDNVRHHVYSFSPAKKFELPLYAGIPAEPVVFDREGIVTLGCNIHDWMLAYVAVLGTPYFQITRDDGRVSLRNLPTGSYQVQVWQPRMKATPDKVAQTVEMGAGEGNASFTLELKPDWRSKKGPALNPEDYR
jgi:plastocyanin